MVAAAYARYSTERQNETSILAQLQAIEAYCAQHDLTLYKHQYIDQAFSGTNTDRPAFQQLLSDANRHCFDAVVIYDISRGSRDVVDWFAFRRQMQQLGIAVYSVTNTLGDLDDPNAFLTEMITAGLGQHMVLQTRQKSIAGKRIKATQGLFCGGVAPYGYRIENERYVIDEQEAPAVRRIFEMYANGYSYGDIIAALSATGFCMRSGNRLKVSTLHSMLCNQRYAGRFIWFEHVERHMHKRVGKPGDPITVENAIPRIISDDVFERVQKRMETKIIRKRGKREYMLSGLLKCGLCGASLAGTTVTSKGIEYPRYSCIRRHKEHNCDLVTLKADILDKAIAQIIREKILNRDLIEQTAQLVIDRYSASKEDTSKLQARVAASSAKIYRLISMAADLPETPPEMRQQIIDETARKKALEAQLAAAQKSELPVTKDDVIALLERDCDRLAETPSLLREMALTYIKQITVYNDRLDICYYLIPGLKNNNPSDTDGLLTGALPRYDARLVYNLTIPRPDLVAA